MTQQQITIELGWPAQALWPNRARRLHWAVKAAAASAARSDAKITALQAVRTSGAYIREVSSITITFHPPTRRRVDMDNALSAMKSAIDGIVNDALGLDDSAIDAVILKRGQVRTGGAVVVQIGGGV